MPLAGAACSAPLSVVTAPEGEVSVVITGPFGTMTPFLITADVRPGDAVVVGGAVGVRRHGRPCGSPPLTALTRSARVGFRPALSMAWTKA